MAGFADRLWSMEYFVKMGYSVAKAETGLPKHGLFAKRVSE